MFLSLIDLQRLLRGVAQLADVRVTQPYENLAPHVVHLEGAISIYGKPMFWETDIDLRELRSQADIAQLLRSLLASFDRAAASDQL